MSHLEADLTELGYLRLPADVARDYFPGDTLVALVKDGEMWLLPTRGAAAGGLFLKQRNARGDRCVLIWEALPAGTAPGKRTAVWDSKRGALRIAL